MPNPQSNNPQTDLPTNLELCPDCEKPTAQIYMRDLTPERRVCAWCFAHHEKEVTVDRTQLGGKSLSDRQVTTGMIKIAVAAVVLLGSGIYLILHLAGGSKAPETSAIADATPGGTAAKGAANKKDSAKPGSADSKAAGAKDAASQANTGAPGDKKPGAPGTPGGASSVTTTAGAAAKADGTGNNGTNSAAASNDDSKDGGKPGAAGSKDKKDAAGGGPASAQAALAMSKGANAKPDDTTPTPFKRGDGASSEDTIKQIEKMIPKTAKNKRPEPTDPAEDASPSDPDQKDGVKGALATEAADGKGGDPVNPKSTEAKKNANAALSQLSSVASKSTSKLSGMAGVASALTEVATRFAPKVKLADGVQRTKARHTSTNSDQDMSLDGGKGEDVWDQLADEAAGGGTASGQANRKGNSGANGTLTPEAAAAEAQRIASGAPKPGSVAAANLAANTAKSGPGAKPAPGTTSIQPAVKPVAPKQTQLNSGVLALNAAGDKPVNGNAIAIGGATATNGAAGANGTAGAKTTPGGAIAVSATPKAVTGGPATALKPGQTELHLNEAIVIGKVDSVDTAPGATALTLKTVNAQLAKIPTALKGEVTVMNLKGDVLFDFGSTTLGDSAGAELDKVAETLSKHPNLPVLIRGYTDAVGSEKSNLTVSTKRAEAVRDWLVKKSGISPKNVTVIGMGASEPVAANKDEKGNDNTQGRAKNRRVTVTLPKIPEASTTTAAASPVVNGGNGATSAQ